MTKEKYILACKTIKGHLIESGTHLEYLLTFIIWHIAVKHEASSLPTNNFFYKTHKKRLFEKINLSEKLMKQYYPTFMNSTNGLFKRLNEIKDFRNDITHSLLDVSREKFEYSDKMYKAIYFASIERNLINNIQNCPERFITFETIKSNIEIIDNVCLALREFLKKEFNDDSL